MDKKTDAVWPPPMPPDPFWNVRNRVIWDNELGVVVEHTSWFPGLVDTCKYLHNTGQYGHKDLRVLAHVDGVVIEAWCARQKVSFDDFTRDDAIRKRFLNDPDNADFRVWKGRV